MPQPILIFSDAPSAHSGLARITRDLATRIASMPEFKVATVGYGSPGSSKLPFQQYQWSKRDDFLIPELPEIWKDFCGDETGIFLTIQDLQRVLWVADPKYCPDEHLAAWLTHMRSTGKMKLWGYFPIDAHGIGGKLGPQFAHILSKYDRRLAYTKFGADVIDKTLGITGTEHIPHGIDADIFKPRNRKIARLNFAHNTEKYTFWPQKSKAEINDALAIGIVATNQQRKDWGLGIEAVAEVAKTREVFLWAHTDAIKREWSILELLSDFKMLERTILTIGNMSDVEMSWAYSAMDVTFGIGRGEGFGYPIAESVFCGTPVIHGFYGGGVDLCSHLVKPTGERIEGPFNLLRPLFNPEDWAAAAIMENGNRTNQPSELEWNNLWPRWSGWLKEGL